MSTKEQPKENEQQAPECKHEKWALAGQPITQNNTTINLLQCSVCKLLLRDEETTVFAQTFSDGAVKQTFIVRTMTFGTMEEK